MYFQSLEAALKFCGAGKYSFLFFPMLAPIFLLSLTGNSYAAHPLITDDTGTQGKGKFQLEVNGGYGHNTDDGITTKTTRIETALTYGVSDPVDIILGMPYEHTRTGDSVLAGITWRF